MKEEQDIIKKCGKENPFRVPEGYFEEFTRNMMAQLQAKGEAEAEETLSEPRITLWQRIKPVLYLAAMFIGMVVCVHVVLGEHPQGTSEGNSGTNLAASEYTLNSFEQMSDEDLARLLDYTRMDNYTLYQYLTEAE